jgi:hypothetical protein
MVSDPSIEARLQAFMPDLARSAQRLFGGDRGSADFAVRRSDESAV